MCASKYVFKCFSHASGEKRSYSLCPVQHLESDSYLGILRRGTEDLSAVIFLNPHKGRDRRGLIGKGKRDEEKQNHQDGPGGASGWEPLRVTGAKVSSLHLHIEIMVSVRRSGGRKFSKCLFVNILLMITLAERMSVERNSNRIKSFY